VNEREMFEKSFQRPKNFLNLSPDAQWAIDKSLGILDWEGTDLNEEECERIRQHYDQPV